MTTDFNVIENGHPFEEGDILERAGDPQLRTLVGFEGANIAAGEEDTAACRRIDATDAVEDARLASTVGANDGKKVRGMDFEVDAGEGDHPTKAQVYILQGQQRHPCPLCAHDAVDIVSGTVEHALNNAGVLFLLCTREA